MEQEGRTKKEARSTGRKKAERRTKYFFGAITFYQGDTNHLSNLSHVFSHVIKPATCAVTTCALLQPPDAANLIMRPKFSAKLKSISVKRNRCLKSPMAPKANAESSFRGQPHPTTAQKHHKVN